MQHHVPVRKCGCIDDANYSVVLQLGTVDLKYPPIMLPVNLCVCDSHIKEMSDSTYRLLNDDTWNTLKMRLIMRGIPPIKRSKLKILLVPFKE